MLDREGSEEIDVEEANLNMQELLNSAAGPSQGTRSQNSSPTRHQPSNSHVLAPKRLFSNLGAMSSKAFQGNDCGSSECSRSLEDIASAVKQEPRAEGAFKLNIHPMSGLKTKVSTSYHYIANLPWRLAAKTECSKRTSNQRFFSVYIDCNPESESTLWSCDAVVEFRLLSQRSDTKSFTRQFTNKFNYNSNNWGFPSFMEWNEINNPEKGFIKNDRVVIEAFIMVQKVVGVRKNPQFDFLSYHPHICDAVLVIEGKKLHISKTYLALYSPVFNAMFFSKFSEREKKEIHVEDVIFDEFVELLNVVYPSHKPVSGDNVEFLLELGDKFEIQYVIDECERFLMSTSELAVVTKLVWADQYCLAKLQHTCIKTFKCVADIKSLKMTEEYKSISDTTKAALLEKIFKIIKD